MENMKHTPEPWYLTDDGRDGLRIQQDDVDVIAWSHDYIDCGDCHVDNYEANFPRIVACVNACAGMEDPAKEIQQLRERVAELQACNALDEVHHAEMSRLLSEKTKSLPEIFFVPCTEQEADEVYELLEANGYTTEIMLSSKQWVDYCKGVKVYFNGSFQSYYNDEGLTEITLPELRRTLS